MNWPREVAELVLAVLALGAIAAGLFFGIAAVIWWGNWLAYTTYTTFVGWGLPWPLAAPFCVAAPVLGVYGPVHLYGRWSRRSSRDPSSDLKA
jgi:hypothetical protein